VRGAITDTVSPATSSDRCENGGRLHGTGRQSRALYDLAELRRVVAGVGFAGQINRGVVRIAHNLITGNSTGVLEYSDGKIMTMTSAGMVTNTIEGNGSNGTFTGTYTAK